MDKIALGKRIREARKTARLTQEILAEKANISSFYLGELERGAKTPSLDVMIMLAEALNVSCDYLLRDSLASASVYVDADISRKLSELTHQQKIAAEAILDAYIKSL